MNPQAPSFSLGRAAHLRSRSFFRALALLAIGASFALQGPAQAAEEVGRVASVEGQATAAAPGEEPRALRCGDPVFADERVVTGAAAGLRIETLNGAELQLGAGSGLHMNLAHGELTHHLHRGVLRVWDGRPAPGVRIAGPGGSEVAHAGDVEIVRVGPDVRVCEWLDAGLASCRLLQANGRASWLEDASPRSLLALGDGCGWKLGLRGLYSPADFLTAAPVSAGPGDEALAFDFDDHDPPCSGDECGGGTGGPGPGVTPVDPTDPERVLTVAPAPIGIPPFPPVIP